MKRKGLFSKVNKSNIFYLHDLQGDLIVLANVGDSRAVLGTTSDDDSLVAVQLTVDFKPNLPGKCFLIQICMNVTRGEKWTG